jgi:hypothetical protein
VALELLQANKREWDLVEATWPSADWPGAGQTPYGIVKKMPVRQFILFMLLFLGGGGAHSRDSASAPPGTDPHAGHGAENRAASLTPPDTAATVVVINQTPPPGPTPSGMVWIPSGAFWMGREDCQMPDALPLHLVSVDGFWMDESPITNALFDSLDRGLRLLVLIEQLRKPPPLIGRQASLHGALQLRLLALESTFGIVADFKRLGMRTRQ